MKCNIELSWRNGDEDMGLTRTKTPEEVWVSPGVDNARSILQMIDVLDQTHADARAALIGMLPKRAKDQVPYVIRMNAEEARNFGWSE